MVVVVVVVLVLVIGGVHGWHRPCEPRGTLSTSSKGEFCVCKPPYNPQGLQILKFFHNGQHGGYGYNRQCCRHCRCASDEELKHKLFGGESNHNHIVQPLDADLDQDEVYKDLVFQMAIEDPSAPGIGDSRYLSTDRFPSCITTVPETKTLDEAVDAITALNHACKNKWDWASRFHDPRSVRILSHKPCIVWYNTVASAFVLYVLVCE